MGKWGCNGELRVEEASRRGCVARGTVGITFTCTARWLAKESSLVGLGQCCIWPS